MSHTSYQLNAFDINFLLSSDGQHLDLPNSITVSWRVSQPIDAQKLLQAFVQVATRFPELKLATEYKVSTLSWVEVNQPVAEYFSELIHQTTDTQSESATLSTFIRKSEYQIPFEVLITPESFFYRQNHHLGDANFALRLLEVVFAVYLNHEDDLNRLTIAPPVSTELLLAHQLPRLAEYHDPNQNQLDFHVNVPPISPQDSVKHQVVLHFSLSPDQLAALEQLRSVLSTHAKVSINTLLNVLLSYFFAEQGYQNRRTYFSIPTHLSPYFSSTTLYPYNFITNIDVYIDTPRNAGQLATAAALTQTSITLAQKDGSLINKALFALATYATQPETVLAELQRVYLSWFTKIEQTFVLSNIGHISHLMPRILAELVLDQHIFLSAPCIGAQPATVFIMRVGRRLNLSWTVDTARIKPSVIQEIMNQLTPERIEKLIADLALH